MTRDEINILWLRAMTLAITDGEMFTRYEFAKLVAAAEREACAMVADLAAAESAQTFATCKTNAETGPALVAVGAKAQSEKLAAAIRARSLA